MTNPLSSPVRTDTSIRRVAILFSGGPAPAANAVIASAAIAFSRAGIEVLGIRRGYAQLASYQPGNPLQEGIDYVRLEHKDLEGKRTAQGILIGTARENPGKKLTHPADLTNPDKTAPLKTVHDALVSLGVDALISIGGDDTLTTAAKFKLVQDRMEAGQKRIRIVHLPKTIDNDYAGIDFTFGYFTAVDLLATEVRNLLADAASTGAYYFAQVMGRKAGWLAYGAAIAGEASLVIGYEDIPKAWWGEEVTILPKTGQPVINPETGQPMRRKVFDVKAMVDRIVETIVARDQEGKPYGVIVMAEGLGEYLPLGELVHCVSEEEFKGLDPDPFGHFPVSQVKFVGRISRLVNQEYRRRTGKKKSVRSMQLGYEVRCQRPTAFDVVLGSQLGVGAYRALVEKGLSGVMVSVTGQLALTFKPFEELMDMQTLRARARLIDPKEDFHQLARYLEVRVGQ